MAKFPKLNKKGYVIYSPSRDLFSGGGSLGFVKKPKIWTRLANLSNHLTLFIENPWNIEYIAVSKNSPYSREDQIIELSEHKIISTVGDEFRRLIENRRKKELFRLNKIEMNLRKNVKNDFDEYFYK